MNDPSFARPIRPTWLPATAVGVHPPEPIGKIAVFRALQLGDLLCAIPAIRALRQAFPRAEITLLGLPWACEFVTRFGMYFDRWIHFPGAPGLPEQTPDAGRFDHFLDLIRSERFDLLLQMQGNGTIVNQLLSEFGARYLAGFHNGDSRMDSALFIDYPEHIHEIKRHQLLVNHLGIPLDGNHLEFPISMADEAEFAALGLPLIKGRYVCIHPGSRGAWRQWPPDHFARLGGICAEKGLQVVLTGTAGEAAITGEVARLIGPEVVDCTGRTSLGAMAVLLRDAALLIANCTGVSHLAAALHTPSLIVSMDGEPHRWAPLDHSRHVTIDWTTRPSLDEVVGALRELLVVYG
jgi:ADP-heptose:LPS heptosyltransferase